MNWLDLLRPLLASRRKDTADVQALQDMDDDLMLAFLRTQNDSADFASTERQIRDAFLLFHWIDENRNLGGRHEPARLSLARRPELAEAFIYHGDGRIREAALKLMDAPIALPVTFYGLVSRLNDWSREVRVTAQQTFARCFSKTSVDVMLPAVWVLLLNSQYWRRWDETNDFRTAVMQRRDLVEAMVSRLVSEKRGGAGVVFRILCQSDHIDALLPDLAKRAEQPHIRAVAVNYLSAGCVRFPLGTVSRRWVDKSSGMFRMVADFEERPIGGYDLAAVIAVALGDNANAVRKEALDAVIRHRRQPSFVPLISRCLTDFAQDALPSIRLRIDFLKRKLEEER